jgi:hypothetical protein
VAAAHRIRNAMAVPVDRGVFYIYRVHTEPVCAQVLDPRAAAASVRVLVDVH